ncbi:MCE family protein [Amycolatopsis sp.]|uniref:MCE family protein n=1 Tax=Amycolatopsis sp. TaxID=37632 RepID=UPI002C5C3AB6|nr:MCE family protein [Amycolatopsis sp.]HVV12668.1 MCE family protein [Amycolatopsis sp.]
MKRFSEMNQTRVGIFGAAGLAVLLAVALNVGSIGSMIVGTSYTAAFAEAGGLHADDDVLVSGYRVGSVSSVDLDGDHVKVSFTVQDVRLGQATGASIKTKSALGTKYLALDPEGPGELEPGSEIPPSRTTSPYDVTQALADLTTTTGQIDTRQLAQSFQTLSDTFAGTPPDLRAALDGVNRLSQTVASRDGALRDVLARASGVSGVLSQRSAEITQLMTDGSSLLQELQNRRDTIHQLLVGISQAGDQLTGFTRDNNATLRPALQQLQSALAVLNKNVGNIDQAIQLIGAFGRSLGEAVGGGPFFYAYLANLAPTNLAPLLPSLFGVGQAPGYGQPAPAQPGPPGVGDRPSPPDQQPVFPKTGGS